MDRRTFMSTCLGIPFVPRVALNGEYETEILSYRVFLSRKHEIYKRVNERNVLWRKAEIEDLKKGDILWLPVEGNLSVWKATSNPFWNSVACQWSIRADGPAGSAVVS